MDPKDLLDLLDLGGAVGSPEPAGPPLITPDRVAPPAAAGPTALVVDEWGLRRGRDLVAESDRLRKAGTDEFEAADFFTVAFDPDPQLRAACVDARRREFLARLLDTPEYHGLHAATRLDDTAAAIAAAHFAEEFARLRKEDEEKPAAADLGREVAALRAAGRAVAEADKEVSELHEASTALGMGPGSPGSGDPKVVAALFRRVRSDPSLRRICELAGRFRRVAQSKQRLKTSHGLDDVVGVEPGGDVGRLLPSELARLVLPELELDTLRRVAERQATCREYHAVEPVGKGPILVTVDESGSMSGEKVHTAKALALALAWIARRQRRWCGLIAYSGDIGERLLSLPPGRWDESALADWLTAFLGRGSTLDVPVRELPDYYRRLGAPPGVTDVVMITDARASIPADVAAAFNAWRRSVRARVVTLVVGGEPGDLGSVSGELHRVPALAADGDAVGGVLSI